MSRAWMPFYVADYLADTGHLSTAEHGAYLLLIMHYWQNGGLPDDERRLARICRMSAEEWETARDAVADFFEAGWKHKRIDAEIVRAQDMSERAKAKAQKRWAKAEDCTGNATADAAALPEECQSQSQSPKSSDASASAQAKPARLESPLDRIWTRHLFDLVSLSGKPEPTVRRWIGKVLSSHDAEPAERAMLAAIAAKTGDPFAYVTRVLTPDPKARGSPSHRKPTVHDAAAALVEWTRANEQHSEPSPLRPMLTAVRS